MWLENILNKRLTVRVVQEKAAIYGGWFLEDAHNDGTTSRDEERSSNTSGDKRGTTGIIINMEATFYSDRS